MNRALARGLLLPAVLLLLLPLLVHAAEVRSAKELTVPAEEKIFDDFYLVGGTIAFDAKAPADLFAAGGEVVLNGTTMSDVIVLGGNLTLNGGVGDDVRIAGGKIVVRAPIGDSLAIAGGEIRIDSPSIGGDVVVAGGKVRLSAPVGGDVEIFGGEVYLDSKIDGNVHVQADRITLGAKAVIAGDFTYTSGQEAKIEEGARVEGATHFTKFAKDKAGMIGLISLAIVGSLLMLLTGALFFGLLASRYSTEVALRVSEKPLASFLWGLGTLILMPIISIVLLLTFIGIPLGALGLIMYVAALIISFLISPVILGSLLFSWLSWSEHIQVTWQSILLGVLAFIIIGIIPIIGGIVKCVLLILAFGAGVHVKWGALRAWR